MNHRVAGLLIGVAIVTSLVVLLLRGEKPKRFLKERFQQLRGTLPEPEQVQQYAQQAATRVSQFAGNAKDTTQQAMYKVKHAGSDLSEKAKQLSPVGN
jgi:gas vesicle protein